MRKKREGSVMKKLFCFVLSLLILLSAFPASALTYDELLQMAEDYAGQGDYDRAFACYDIAVSSEPDKAAAYINAGLLHLDRGDLAAAGESIEKALTADAASPDAWAAKCRIDIAAGDAAAFEADALYAEICGADMSDYSADIGQLYAKAGYSEKAVSWFSRAAVETMNDEQKAYYYDALISCGEKEKADALGLDPAKIRNVKLDAAFDSGHPHLAETESVSVKLQASDFEFTDEAKAALADAENIEDIDAALAERLQNTEFLLISKSPSGNSGLVSAGETAVAFYNGKYAFICNRQFTLMKWIYFIDPILLDLSTGELILTATYPDNPIKDDHARAVTSAMFSSDNQYFYYVLIGTRGEPGTCLNRYHLSTGETETCFTSEKRMYLPQIAELEDGSILLLGDAEKDRSSQYLVIASFNNGTWVFKEEEIKLSFHLFYTRRIIYSSNAGLVCLVGTPESYDRVSGAFQLIHPENNFDGIDKFWCIKTGTNELISFSPEEYQELAEPDAQNEDEDKSYEPQYLTIWNAVFSPDGRYLLLFTINPVERNLLLLRLEDMTLQKVSGLDAWEIVVSTKDYPKNFEWNTDELIITTNKGIKTFTFTDGQ